MAMEVTEEVVPTRPAEAAIGEGKIFFRFWSRYGMKQSE